MHDGMRRTIFPLDRTWMMLISQNHNSKKTGNPDTSGPWDEMGGSGSARLRKEPEGLCSKAGEDHPAAIFYSTNGMVSILRAGD